MSDHDGLPQMRTEVVELAKALDRTIIRYSEGLELSEVHVAVASFLSHVLDQSRAALIAYGQGELIPDIDKAFLGMLQEGIGAGDLAKAVSSATLTAPALVAFHGDLNAEIGFAIGRGEAPTQASMLLRYKVGEAIQELTGEYPS